VCTLHEPQLPFYAWQHAAVDKSNAKSAARTELSLVSLDLQAQE
jgi:hypothetical protein